MYITTNSHTLYIYIFHYYLMPAPDYTVIISFPLFAPYFFHDCTVIIPFLLFAPYFFRDCTVIISFLLFAPYFFHDCTVIISFLLFAPYLFRDCTVIIPFLLFAPYFGADYTVIIYLSSLYTVFLSGVPSNIQKIREALKSTILLSFMNAADRNRTGTGITTHGILSHLVPTDFPRTNWYEMELRVPKNGDFLPARNSLNDKLLANSV